MDVVVVGGGVVGLSTAFFLQEEGASVTVVDAGACGGATSTGNAGWVTPVLAAPLPGPGVIAEGLRSMLGPHSPVVIRPRPSADFARWAVRFARSASSARHHAGVQAMLGLGRATLEGFDRLRAAGVAFEDHPTGMTFVFRSEQTFEHYAGQLCPLPARGYPGEVRVWSGAEAREAEPALADSIIGAIHATADGYVRPETLCAGLLAAVEARGGDVRQFEGVRDVAAQPDGSWRVRTPVAELRADAVVIATGATTAAFLRGLGVRLLIEPGKGHSLTSRGSGLAPTRALYLADRHVGLSAYDGGVRLAGLLELNTSGTNVSERYVATLRVAAEEFLRDWRPGGDATAWAGLRTFAPDGLPVIGPVPGHRSLFVATGHGMMGVTLGPGTGATLAQAVVTGRAPEVLAPFDPGRPAVLA